MDLGMRRAIRHDLYDYSTINQIELSKLPTYTLAPSYKLQAEPGNGCAGDPPGFPTYFTRSIYTMYGNTPGRGPVEGLDRLVIPNEPTEVFGIGRRSLFVTRRAEWPEGATWDSQQETYMELMKRLWKPLPLGHPRTRAWIIDIHIHMNHCYYWPKDHFIPEAYSYSRRERYDDMVIWPVPDYKLEHFRDDPRFSDEWREHEKARIEDFNRMVIEATRPLATPENHKAVRLIRRFYPEYEPEVELVEHPPKRRPGNWWERFAAPPSPEECPGAYDDMPHPSNGKWCQLCGWYAEDEEKQDG